MNEPAPDHPPAPAPGLLLLSRYQLIERIGADASGELWLAHDQSVGQPVALRFLPAASLTSPLTRRRVGQAFALARRASHPHLARVFNLEPHGDSLLVVEEPSRSPTLGETLRARLASRPDKPYSPPEILTTITQICAALLHLHQDLGCGHGSLTLDTVRIDPASRAVKLEAPAWRRALTDDSPDALAPAGDLRALAALCYELLVGRPPPPVSAGTLPVSMREHRRMLGVSADAGPIAIAWENAVAAGLAPSASPPDLSAFVQTLGLIVPGALLSATARLEASPPPLTHPVPPRRSAVLLSSLFWPLLLALPLLGVPSCYYFVYHRPYQRHEAARLQALRDEAASAAAERQRAAEEAQRRRLAKEQDPTPAPRIEINTIPPGGLVTVLDVRETPAPVELTRVPPGKHRVTVTLPDHERLETEIHVLPGRSSVAYLKLERSVGSLAVESTPPRLDYVLSGPEDKPLEGVTPFTVEKLPTGAYTLRVVRDGYPVVKREIVMARGEHREVSIDFGAASLEVRSTPAGAAVFDLEGRRLGRTPLTFDQINSGPVALRLALTDHRPVVLRGDLKPGDNSVLAATLAPQATPDMRSSFVNSLGVGFFPVPRAAVLFSQWETRERDFAAFHAEQTATGLKRRPREFLPAEADLPVTKITAEDARVFCVWLTQRELDQGRILPGQKYRMPTSDEWSQAATVEPGEKASGFNPRFAWGTEWPPPANAANLAVSLKKDVFAQRSPAGSFPPGPHGLFDLTGNVSEMVESPAVYPQIVVRSADYTSSSNLNCDLRSWYSTAGSAARETLGFRIVFDPRRDDSP